MIRYYCDLFLKGTGTEEEVEEEDVEEEDEDEPKRRKITRVSCFNIIINC